MDAAAALLRPSFVVSTGDNFYKDGVTSASDPAWLSSFGDVYSGPALSGLPWYAVLGNHGAARAQDCVSRVRDRRRSRRRRGALRGMAGGLSRGLPDCGRLSTISPPPNTPRADWRGNVTAQTLPSPLFGRWHGSMSFAAAAGGRTDHWAADAGAGAGARAAGEAPLLSVVYVDTSPWARLSAEKPLISPPCRAVGTPPLTAPRSVASRLPPTLSVRPPLPRSPPAAGRRSCPTGTTPRWCLAISARASSPRTPRTKGTHGHSPPISAAAFPPCAHAHAPAPRFIPPPPAPALLPRSPRSDAWRAAWAAWEAAQEARLDSLLASSRARWRAVAGHHPVLSFALKHGSQPEMARWGLPGLGFSGAACVPPFPRPPLAPPSVPPPTQPRGEF